MFRRRSTFFVSTDSQLDEEETSNILSISPDETATFSSTQHLFMSVIHIRKVASCLVVSLWILYIPVYCRILTG